MSGTIKTEADQLDKAGKDFIQAGVDLGKYLSTTAQLVNDITSKGLEGKAQQRLIDTYDKLSTELAKYPKKLNQIGESLVQSAANQVSVDDAAEQAARISM